MATFISILLKHVKIQQCIYHPELIIKFLVLHPIFLEQNQGTIFISFVIVADLHIVISSITCNYLWLCIICGPNFT